MDKFQQSPFLKKSASKSALTAHIISRKLENSLNVNNVKNIVTAIEDCAKLPLLRPMQQKALCAVAHAIRQGKRKLFVKMPTASGKTYVMSMLTKILTDHSIASMTMIPSNDLAEQSIASLLQSDYSSTQ